MMRKFNLNASKFILVLFLINFFFYGIIDRKYWRSYRKVDLRFETYLLSDSHGLSLKQFSEEFGIYNFSAASESYHDMHRKVEYLIDNSRVKRIIITAENHTLSPYRDKNNNLDRSILFVKRDRYKTFYGFLKERYIKHFIVILNPKGANILEVAAISSLRNSMGRKSSKDSDWSSFTEIEKLESTSRRVNQQFPSAKGSTDLYDSLVNIIKLCKKNDIELVGIKYPLTDEYIKATKQLSFGADKVFQESGLRVYDFSKLYEGNSEYFSDPDHLDVEGGEKMARLLGKVIESLQDTRTE